MYSATMFFRRGIFLLSALLLFTPSIGTGYAAGLLKAKNGSGDHIIIQSHKVLVTINNGYAKTEVDQVFFNTGESDLEAVYSFPLPRKAALSELSLFIDGREQLGEVLEKARAKQIYQEQKEKGRHTAHAGKDAYTTFRVAVSPVRANNSTRVRLVYYQPLDIDLNVGRYVYPLAEGGVDEQQLAFWTTDDRVDGTFSFDLTLKSAVAIQDVRMPGYMNQAEITTTDRKNETGNAHFSHVHLVREGEARLAKDIVFYYRLDDTAPARVELVPFRVAAKEDGEKGRFMLVVTPGASLAPVTEGVDWIFVLDTSGSMSGEKIDTLRQGVAKVLPSLKKEDRFHLLTFSDRVQQLTRAFLPATPENIAMAGSMVQGISASGGTNLYQALERGLQKSEEGRTTALVVISDGVANVGKTAHRDFLSLLNKKDVRLFTFLMGNSGNRPLLDDLAGASGGFAMDISPDDDLTGRMLQAKARAAHRNFHDVEIELKGDGIEKIFPEKIGSLYLGQQAVLFGSYSQPGNAELIMTARISGEPHQWRCRVVLPANDEDNPEIERLWALAAIEENMKKIREDGERQGLKEEVITLGVGYSLVTDYTSMVVVEKEEMEAYGITAANSARVARERAAQAKKQALPAKNFRADSQSGVYQSEGDGSSGSGSNEMFAGSPAPGPGSGPVGPFFLLFLGGIVLLRKYIR